MIERIQNLSRCVKIALVGKYVKLHDAYLSVAESLRHAGYENGAKVEIDWVDSETLTDENVASRLKGADGIIVPAALGTGASRAWSAPPATPARRASPISAVCLGMQIAVIEYFRHVVGYEDAHSGEFDPNTPHQVYRPHAGPAGEHTPRAARCGWARIPASSRRRASWRAPTEGGNHRAPPPPLRIQHSFRKDLEGREMTVTGQSPDGRLVEAVELAGRPFFVGVQYHPEFKSRPNRAHPLFREFIRASLER
jgi:CTP synthase